MLERGFQAEPTDGSPEIARKAEQRIGASVRVMRFDELEADGDYDAVWANASLLHVPVSQLPEVLGRIHRSLKAQGLHFASYKSGGAEGRDRFGRYFNYLSVPQLETAYASAGPWEVLAREEFVGGGYEGGQGPWVAITTRKTG